MAVDFLCNTSPEALAEQIFWLMYTTMGSGLGQPFSEIMKMPVRWRLQLYEQLIERLQEEYDAMKGG